MKRLIIAVLCLVAGCAQQEVNTRAMRARPLQEVATVKHEVRPGMTRADAEAILERLFPEHLDWWWSAGGTVVGTAVCEYYQVDPDTTVVLRYRADTDINIPDTEKITEVEVNRFEDLKKEIPADLYEHVRLLRHLPGCEAMRYDPAALIRVINDLQPLGKQEALEVLRTYERLAGDGILAVKEQWKEGEAARRSSRARRYGITTDDWRLLPIPGLLFVQEDGTPIPGSVIWPGRCKAAGGSSGRVECLCV